MKTVLVCLAVFVIVSVGFIKGQSDKSDCVDRRTKKSGVCKPYKECTSAVTNAQKGIHPTICDFKPKIGPIVCCEKELVNPLILEEDEPYYFPTEKPKERLRVSEQKCQGFLNLTTDYINVLALVTRPNPTTFNISKCDHDGVPLIVGGVPATAGEFPYMAALRYGDGEFRCGGTLISENFVMSAAHCTRTRYGAPTTVRLGTLSLTKHDGYSDPVDMDIAKVITHPEYTPMQKYNDISLLQLRSNVKFTKYVRPACLWTKNTITQPKAVATGWGDVSFGGDSSHDALQRVTLDILPKNKCQDVFKNDRKLQYGITDNMLCSGVLAGDKDTCQGDSGGPLVITKDDNNCVFYVVGITSFGRFCGHQNVPAIYTRVSEYLPWIEKNVWPLN